MTIDAKCRCLRRGPLSAFADGELDSRRAADVAAHLSRCPGCSRIVSDYRRLSRGFQEWSAAERKECGPVALWPGVVRGIETAARERPSRWGWRRILSWPQPLWVGGMAAAAALILALVLPSGRGGGDVPLPSQYCRIDSIAAPDRQLTIYQDRQDGFTVIWLGNENG